MKPNVKINPPPLLFRRRRRSRCRSQGRRPGPGPGRKCHPRCRRFCSSGTSRRSRRLPTHTSSSRVSNEHQRVVHESMGSSRSSRSLSGSFLRSPRVGLSERADGGGRGGGRERGFHCMRRLFSFSLSRTHAHVCVCEVRWAESGHHASQNKQKSLTLKVFRTCKTQSFSFKMCKRPNWNVAQGRIKMHKLLRSFGFESCLV